MNQELLDYIIILMLFIGIIGFWIILIFVLTDLKSELSSINQTISIIQDRQENIQSQTLRLVKYNETVKEKMRLYGIAYADEYYCVWTKDKNYCDIMNIDPSLECVNETAFHELMHIELYNNSYYNSSHWLK
jgi:hypothetical protein